MNKELFKELLKRYRFTIVEFYEVISICGRAFVKAVFITEIDDNLVFPTAKEMQVDGYDVKVLTGKRQSFFMDFFLFRDKIYPFFFLGEITPEELKVLKIKLLNIFFSGDNNERF